jgi:hypothetical protein
VKILFGQDKILGKGAVKPPQTQDPAFQAVSGQPTAAAGADPAGNVDLAHYPLAQQGGLGRSYNLPHKLVARNAPVSVVAFEDFQVGAAEARQAEAHQGFARLWFGTGNLFQFGNPVKI